MSQSLQAIYENGVLRPLERLMLREGQEVEVTVNTLPSSMIDEEFLQSIEEYADVSVTIEEVRLALSSIPGNLSDDIRREREER